MNIQTDRLISGVAEMGCSSSAAVNVKEKKPASEKKEEVVNNQVLPLPTAVPSEPQTAEKPTKSPRGNTVDTSKIKLVKVWASEGSGEQNTKSVETIPIDAKHTDAKEQTQPLRRLATTRIQRVQYDPLVGERILKSKLSGNVRSH